MKTRVSETAQDGRVTARSIRTAAGTVHIGGKNLTPLDPSLVDRAARAVDDLAATGIRRAWFRHVGPIKATFAYGRNLTRLAQFSRSRIVIGGGRFGMTLTRR